MLSGSSIFLTNLLREFNSQFDPEYLYYLNHFLCIHPSKHSKFLTHLLTYLLVTHKTWAVSHWQKSICPSCYIKIQTLDLRKISTLHRKIHQPCAHIMRPSPPPQTKNETVHYNSTKVVNCLWLKNAKRLALLPNCLKNAKSDISGIWKCQLETLIRTATYLDCAVQH